MIKGLTLIEALVSIVILAIIFLCVFAVSNIGDMSWRTDMGLLTLHQQTRHAMHGMVREIRQIDTSGSNNITITNTSYGTEIEFYVINVTNSIRYYVNNNRIFRSHGTTTRTICNDIDMLSFCCQHGSTCDTDCSETDAVEIQVGARKSVRNRNVFFNLTEQILLRN